jgi:hypothetical protein
MVTVTNVNGEWGVGDEGDEGNNQCPMPNAQCPMPNYDMSIFSFFFFLKGTRTKL